VLPAAVGCQANGVPVFKRRKPEEPPVPPSRGHVIAAGPEQATQTLPGMRGASGTAAVESRESDPSFAIPAMPEAPSPQLSPVAPTPPQPKEPIFMSRPPLQPTPTAPTMPQGGMPHGSLSQGGMSPGSMSQSGLSRAPMAPARMPPQAGDRRTLVVGRGISVQGTITDAERLVVEGTVEASSLNAAELQIAQGGVLKGQVEVEDAEISGLMDGILTVKGSLVLRGSGQVIGEARCRRLQVEDGGQLSGKISMIPDGAAVPHVPADANAA
jgi:cytoskeletal protein CcmA (bactofilin family)